MRLSLGLALVARLLLVSPVSLAADFDHDGDGDVDIFDVADFFACCDGPDLLVSGDCADSHDANSDLDVDLLDFGELQLDFGRMGSVLGQCLTSQGRYDEAEPLLLEGYHMIRNVIAMRRTQAARAQSRLVELYHTRGKPVATEYSIRGGPGRER